MPNIERKYEKALRCIRSIEDMATNGLDCTKRSMRYTKEEIIQEDRFMYQLILDHTQKLLAVVGDLQEMMQG